MFSLGTIVPDTRLSFLVFHGGSGSTKDEIKTAVQNGVVKMNVDTAASAYVLVTAHASASIVPHSAGDRQDFIQNKSG